MANAAPLGRVLRRPLLASSPPYRNNVIVSELWQLVLEQILGIARLHCSVYTIVLQELKCGSEQRRRQGKRKTGLRVENFSVSITANFVEQRRSSETVQLV